MFGLTILYYNNKGYGYFKVNSYGISWKDTSRQVLSFSERMELVEIFRYKTWIIREIR
jgi:hypothetical protein